MIQVVHHCNMLVDRGENKGDVIQTLTKYYVATAYLDT